MLMELLSNMADFSVSEMKKSDPEKYNNFVKTAISLTEAGVEMLKESPEFREAFAKIHNEFLKHPESRSTIEQALVAQKNFGPEVNYPDKGYYTNPIL